MGRWKVTALTNDSARLIAREASFSHFGDVYMIAERWADLGFNVTVLDEENGKVSRIEEMAA